MRRRYYKKKQRVKLELIFKLAHFTRLKNFVFLCNVFNIFNKETDLVCLLLKHIIYLLILQLIAQLKQVKTYTPSHTRQFAIITWTHQLVYKPITISYCTKPISSIVFTYQFRSRAAKRQRTHPRKPLFLCLVRKTQKTSRKYTPTRLECFLQNDGECEAGLTNILFGFPWRRHSHWWEWRGPVAEQVVEIWE